MKVATICFLIKDDQVLLSEKKEGFGTGFLNGYGGKVKGDETPEMAAVRELAEESGAIADPADADKMAVIDFFDGETHIFECHVFFVRKWRGEPKESNEMAAPQWYPRENMPYDRMWKGDRDWLPLIFSGKKIQAKAYYKPGMAEMDRFEHEPLVS